MYRRRWRVPGRILSGDAPAATLKDLLIVTLVVMGKATVQRTKDVTVSIRTWRMAIRTGRRRVAQGLPVTDQGHMCLSNKLKRNAVQMMQYQDAPAADQDRVVPVTNQKMRRIPQTIHSQYTRLAGPFPQPRAIKRRTCLQWKAQKCNSWIERFMYILWESRTVVTLEEMEPTRMTIHPL